jgi:penicillin-binding protein 1A
LFRLFKYLFWLGFNLAVIGVSLVAYLFYINSLNLPSYDQLATYQPPIVTRFYSSDGRLLEEYAKEHRLFVPIANIPPLVKFSFIAAEDKNFYSHPGVDFTGILRAAIKNIIASSQGKKSLVGGSTITQQVVKNFLLTNEKSINRKIKEAILSFRITKVFSKDKILELYLNEIYLGARSYGVASAALNYFNKSLNELNLQEAAFLAALPQAPSYYNPHKNIKRALARRNWVIERMRDDGYISENEAENAILQPIKLSRRSPDNVATANFFAETVRSEIAKMYGEKALYESGLVVRTSLDPHIEEIAEKSLRDGLIAYDKKRGYRGAITNIKLGDDWVKKIKEMNIYGFNIKPWIYAKVIQVSNSAINIELEDKSIVNVDIEGSKWALSGKNITKTLFPGDIIIVDKKNRITQVPRINGAIVAMDPHTGRVLALVGGYSFEGSKFNRATQAIRQPGSSFKPFVYLAGLENGISPADIFLDGPIELEQGPGLPVWKPKNFYNDFYGDITFRRGLEFSRNPITVRVAQAIGIEKVAEIAKRFGIAKDPQPYYSMVLGALETTLLRMTNAYAIIANGGRKVTPSLIDKIQDRNGNLVYSSDERPCINCVSELNNPYIKENRPFITDPRSAYQMTSILEGVIQRTKTSANTRALGYTLAGKTGTTNKAKDTWFIGYSPDLVVGVFVGFDDPKSLGEHSSGAMVAQPIFVNFMKNALVDYIDKPFKIPPGIELEKIDYLNGKPTTMQKGSIYEAIKSENYDAAPEEEIKAEIKIESELENGKTVDIEDFDINETNDEEIY